MRGIVVAVHRKETLNLDTCWSAVRWLDILYNHHPTSGPHGRCKREIIPGVSMGTRIIDCCWCAGAEVSLLPYGKGREYSHDLRLAGTTTKQAAHMYHHNQELAAGIASARSPPLLAVDNVGISVPFDQCRDVGSVR
jgi:hypothetical protein